MENKFECEVCKRENGCGVYLDTKNVGKYPEEVCHTWIEKRLKICGSCYGAILKVIGERAKL